MSPSAKIILSSILLFPAVFIFIWNVFILKNYIKLNAGPSPIPFFSGFWTVIVVYAVYKTWFSLFFIFFDVVIIYGVYITIKEKYFSKSDQK
jgi:hypothetical protein